LTTKQKAAWNAVRERGTSKYERITKVYYMRIGG